MPRGYPIGEITAYGNLMSQYWHAPAGREVVGEFFFQKQERLPQYCMEAVLRRKLATLPNVDMRLGVTATAVTQSNDGVRATVADERGETETLEADYLVGCDGGHSMVRAAAGIARSGTDFDQVMVLVVFRSRELHEKLKRFPERSTYRVMHPDLHGYWKFFGRVDVGERFFFHTPVPPEASAAISISAGRCSTPPAFRSPSRSSTPASGICAMRLPPATGTGASSLPAMPRTAIRLMAVTASTTAWKTRSI